MGDLLPPTIPPTEEEEAEFTTADFAIPDAPKVVVLVDSPGLRREIETALWDARIPPSGASALASAIVVLVEIAPGGAEGSLAKVRARARADAAIVVVRPSNPDDAHAALAAGALAVLRDPFDPTELTHVVRSAIGAEALRTQAASLTTKLDLQTHLASLGRLTAGLTHEVASPLASARTNADVVSWELEEIRQLVAAPTPQNLSRAQERIVEAQAAVADTLHAMERISELFELVKGLARQQPPTLDRIVLGVAVQRALDDLSPNERESVELERVVDTTAEVRGSSLLVRQIVTNLVANALRAARSLGAPRVRVHVYEAGTFGVVSVRDNGPGIPVARQEQIFEPFYTTHREHGGLGLGLALCREYALQMEARLSVESTPGRGACFRLHLPKV